MACSSIIERGSSSSNSSSLTQRRNYDVFISFRGEDTRYNITDILFGALQEKCIFAFRDDKNLPKGESIAPELLLAIEGSQVFVVIFSKNYASSTWCLRELEKIVESSQVIGKHIIPIFYDVDPSDVRHQKGSFDETFKKHEESFKHDLQIVRRWREVLTHVANLSGFDLRDNVKQGKNIHPRTKTDPKLFAGQIPFHVQQLSGTLINYLTDFRSELVFGVNMKVVDLFVIFPTHICTPESDACSSSYDPNTRERKSQTSQFRWTKPIMVQRKYKAGTTKSELWLDDDLCRPAKAKKQDFVQRANVWSNEQKI